jgi:hypothetical protein
MKPDIPKEVLDLLWKLLDEDSEQVWIWLQEPRPQWHNLSALNLIEMGRIEVIRAVLKAETEGYGEISSS